MAQSAVWLWPLFQEDWHTSVTGPTAIANCLALELFDSARTMPPQEAGFYLYDQAWEKALLRAWRKHGHGKLVGVQHAIGAFWHLYYFDDPRSRDPGCAMPSPDFFAVNGLAARHAFLDTGYPAEKLVDAEDTRYLNLLSLVEPDGMSAPARRGIAKVHILRVLILGDIVRGSRRIIFSCSWRAP